MGMLFEEAKMQAIGLEILRGTPAGDVMARYDCGKSAVETAVKVAVRKLSSTSWGELHAEIAKGRGLLSAARSVYRRTGPSQVT